MVSRGESNTRCSATVSSTTPRFGPKWPPTLATAETRKARICSASAGSCAASSARSAAGLQTRPRISRSAAWTGAVVVGVVPSMIRPPSMARAGDRNCRTGFCDSLGGQQARCGPVAGSLDPPLGGGPGTVPVIGTPRAGGLLVSLRDAYPLYGFARYADEIVDNGAPSTRERDFTRWSRQAIVDCATQAAPTRSACARKLAPAPGRPTLGGQAPARRRRVPVDGTARAARARRGPPGPGITRPGGEVRDFP